MNVRSCPLNYSCEMKKKNEHSSVSLRLFIERNKQFRYIRAASL